MNHTTRPIGVEIDPATLRWVGSLNEACFLTLAPTDGSDPAAMLPTVEQAIATADLEKPGEHPIRVAAVVEGTDALHIRLRYGAANRGAVREWATGLAQALTAAGLSGTLRRPIPQYPDQWVTSGAVHNRAVSVLYAPRVPIDHSMVERLASAHSLDLFPHHALSGGSEFTFSVPYNRKLMAAIPAMERVVGLDGWADQPADQAFIQASVRTATGWTHAGDRQAQADRARAALHDLAPDVHHAFAEVTKGPGRFSSPLQTPPDGISPSIFAQNQELWPHRVFDAHGLQVLTADHLERAHDLDDWHTHRIGDRYLVEARDLHGWYGDDEPDPQLLDRARADFGDMIITETEWRAHKAAERDAMIRAYQERLARGEET